MFKILGPVPAAEAADVKEVYAFYGLAAYAAQVLEKGLVNLVVALSTEGVSITRTHFDALFDRFDARAFGQLVSVANARVEIPGPSQQLLAEALTRRHHLSHQFFAEHAAAFTTDEGRAGMIEELRILVDLLQRADAEVERLYLPLMLKHGMTDDKIKQLTEETLARFLQLASSGQQN